MFHSHQIVCFWWAIIFQYLPLMLLENITITIFHNYVGIFMLFKWLHKFNYKRTIYAFHVIDFRLMQESNFSIMILKSWLSNCFHSVEFICQSMLNLIDSTISPWADLFYYHIILYPFARDMKLFLHKKFEKFFLFVF